MLRRLTQPAVALLAVAALAAPGCGEEAPTTATATTAATTDTDLTVPALARMGAVPAARHDLPGLRTPGIADPAFMRAAFDAAQAMWRTEFEEAGLPYEDARLVFFDARGEVATACGVQSSAVGPFYCPADRTAYLSTGFFAEIARRYGLRSGFAAGYITGHEIAHHVQAQLGLLGRLAAVDARDPANANARSVRLELQADCYAGLWLRTVADRDELTTADLEDIVRTAAIVGADHQARRAGAPLAPETWTHGTSAQRVAWLATGKREGDPAACDTFAQPRP